MNLDAAMRPYLDQFQDELNKYLVKRELEPKQLYDAVRHLPNVGGGKRLRPLIAILSAQTVGGDSKKIMPYGVAIELLHSFTLVHDDIMDDCDTRRGIEAVHKKYGTPMGILAGDTMFALVFEILNHLEINDERYRHIVLDVANLAREVCEGQFHDTAFEDMKKIDELQYYHMIERKTATFFETAMKNGAELGGADNNQIKKLSECGRLLGLAYQVWDDYLGATASEADTGKPAYSDIVNAKKTLVYVATHERLDPFDRRQFVDLYMKKEKTDKEIQEVIKFMGKAGGKDKLSGLDYTKKRAREFSSFAKATLSDLPETAAKRLLGLLCDYASSRAS